MIPGSGDFVQWKPDSLRALSEAEIRYSNGFLRSNPLRWMGAVKNHWAALLESSNLELKLIELKPSLTTQFDCAQTWFATVNSYPIACGCDHATLDAIFSMSSKNLRITGRSVVLDYFGRRLLGTLAMSWNGPAFESFEYQRTLDPNQRNWGASVQVRVDVSGRQLTFYYLLSSYLLDVLDGLWIRQRLASAKKQGELTLNLELGDVEVASSELPKMLTPGRKIAFNGAGFDSVQLVSRTDNIIFGGKLVRLGNNLGVQIVSGSKSIAKPAEGNVRLAFVLGQAKINAEMYAEVSQPGALLKTDIPLTSRVALSVSGARQGDGVLGFADQRPIILVG